MSNEIKVVLSDVNKIITKVNWLSSNDYTTAEKTKVASMPTNASQLPFTPTGNLSSTDVQTALAEIASKITEISVGYTNDDISNDFIFTGRMSHLDGALLTAVTTHSATDFMDCEGAEFLFRYVLDGTFTGTYIAYHVAWYDADKNFISGEYPNTTYTVTQHDGRYGIKYMAPENAKFVRASMLTTNLPGGTGNDYYYLIVRPVKKLRLTDDYNTLEIARIDEDIAEINIKSHLQDKKIACFGDSIFGNFRDGTGITDVMTENTGATIYNFGFGGTYISLRDGMNSQDIYWDEFSMVRIADYIASGDFTPMDIALASMTSALSYFPSVVAELKTIDWNDIDIITIEQGTNDFTGHNLAKDESDLDDKLTYYGAYKYVIEKILTAYPHLKIVLLTPTWRYWFDAQGEFIDDSDTRLMNAGIPLTDFVDVVKEIGRLYKIPVIDNYYELGLNKFTRNVFLQDGTHPNVEGRIRIGDRVSHMLLSIL